MSVAKEVGVGAFDLVACCRLFRTDSRLGLATVTGKALANEEFVFLLQG